MTLVCDLNNNEKLLDEAEYDLKNPNNNSPIQDYVHPDDQTQPTFFQIFHDLKNYH